MACELIVELSAGTAPSLEAEFSRAEAETRRVKAEVQRAEKMAQLLPRIDAALAQFDDFLREFEALKADMGAVDEVLDLVLDGGEAPDDAAPGGEEAQSGG